MKLSNSAPIDSHNVPARMAPEMAATFSPAQVQALQVALTPRRHPVNSRLSLPLGITRIYRAMLQITNVDLPAVFNPRVAPAEIPFKTDRTSCKESDRTWREGDCLDFGHDPTF
ncbi:MAG: hypothetical protein DCF32_21340 [Leptolyngbya sp.]|nr:MAG: hypothetical protein DCF32_21340 [Leptolyngbya sp.]